MITRQIHGLIGELPIVVKANRINARYLAIPAIILIYYFQYHPERFL